jgi:hypothetical protein
MKENDETDYNDGSGTGVDIKLAAKKGIGLAGQCPTTQQDDLR